MACLAMWSANFLSLYDEGMEDLGLEICVHMQLISVRRSACKLHRPSWVLGCFCGSSVVRLASACTTLNPTLVDKLEKFL